MEIIDSKKAYIFLDIDGVLAVDDAIEMPKDKWFSDRVYPLTEKCVKVLNEIILQTDAELILSSDWRRVFSLEEMDEIFRFYKVAKSPVASTKIWGDRDAEIENFVKTHKLSRFLIIDDLPLNVHRTRLIQTDSAVGLLTVQINKAVQLLK